MKQAAIYVRCARPSERSTKEQVALCAKAAASRGYTVRDEHVFRDDGVSGRREPGQRRGFSALTEALEGASLEAVIVRDLARLSRHLGDLATLLTDLERRGVRVIGVG